MLTSSVSPMTSTSPRLAMPSAVGRVMSIVNACSSSSQVILSSTLRRLEPTSSFSIQIFSFFSLPNFNVNVGLSDHIERLLPGYADGASSSLGLSAWFGPVALINSI